MKTVVIATIVLSLPFLTACGNESGTNDTTVSIAISPTSSNVEIGNSVELTVTARNTAIIWPDQGDIDGSFTINGNRVIYVPPSIPGTYRFTVTAEADTSSTVTARITVVYAAPQITVAPATAETRIGRTIQFTTTTMIPIGQPQHQDPEWDIVGACGEVNQNGLFSATRSGSCTVRAALRDNNNRRITGTAIVTVTPPTLDDIMSDMVQVRGGTFTMGCSGSDCSHTALPAHSVTLDDFYIGRYQVTQFVWKQVMGAWDNPSRRPGDNLPVEIVSWDEIQTFIERLNEMTGRNYRLPTEAEWEYAARGGNQSGGYMYSGSDTPDDVGWYIDNSDGRIHPVGMKKANELGIHDMSGNVDEWVNDWYAPYSGDPRNNPTGPESGSNRVVRGGSAVRDAEAARVFSRGGYGPSLYNPNLGFRLAR